MWYILLSEFIRDLRKQKLRAFLTIMAISWGTFAVILLLAFGQGLSSKMIEGLLGGGNQVMMIYPGQTSTEFNGLPPGRRIRFTEEDLRLIQERVPGIAYISPQYGRHNMNLRSPHHSVNTYGEGVGPDYEIMRTVFPAQGSRFINPNDVAEQRRVVFLGDEIAAELFPDNDAVGSTLFIDATPFTIIGLMQPKLQTSMNNGPDSRRAIMPYTTYRNMYNERYLGSILVSPENPQLQQHTVDEIMKVLAGRYQFDPADTEAVFIWDFIEFEEMNRKVADGITLFLFSVGFFTLLIAGVGVANIMYVVVKERTHEIGVKKALGARRKHILLQFITESLLISFAGGLLGIAAASGIIRFVISLNLTEGAGEFFGQPILSYQVVLVTVGLLTLIGFAAGVFPARKAAALQPVEALRYE
ncbi:MAG: ABC transporter permease [Candidatus Cyclonatronum sp.]|uniref:ABC transporter permease n=1 Tax=Cyclonatronum sp. TaxID=3024185 RepID=UPI0025BC0CB6|nr:ABC transporter permease [Cyclonatronum sp.]MCH8485996.1 ABC transporter permease [Cyclonatronum sp.]